MKCAWTAAQIWVMHEHSSGSGPALRLLLLVCDEIGRCLKRFVRTQAPITWILNVLVLDRHLQICQMSISSGSEEENGRNSAVEVSKARSPSLVNKPSKPTSPVVRPFRRAGEAGLMGGYWQSNAAVFVSLQLHRD
jgi:hypothetical protein